MAKKFWYHVKENLPTKEETIVILLDNRVPLVARFNGFEFTDDGLEIQNVTHWMRLPAIPNKYKQLSEIKE